VCPVWALQSRLGASVPLGRLPSRWGGKVLKRPIRALRASGKLPTHRGACPPSVWRERGEKSQTRLADAAGNEEAGTRNRLLPCSLEARDVGLGPTTRGSR